jgi:hypothetical protein
MNISTTLTLAALTISATTALAAPGPALASSATARTTQAAAPAAKSIERRLFSDSFESSTFLWNDWNKFQENYHANYAGDDDPKTAWVEGDTGSGAGQWLRMNVTKLDDTTAVRFKIRNGYQKSPDLFKANARAKQVTIVLLPKGVKQEVTLKDEQGWQEVVIKQDSGEISGVEMRVSTVYEGTKYQDLSISDVQVFATSSVKDNPGFEKQKRTKLMAWRAARVAAAKEFANGKIATVLYPQYVLVTTERPAGPPSEFTATTDSEWRLHHIRDTVAYASALPQYAQWQSSLAVAQSIAEQFNNNKSTVLSPAKMSAGTGGKLPLVDGVTRTVIGDFNYGGVSLPSVNANSIFFADRTKVVAFNSSQTVDTYLESEKCKGQRTWIARTADPEHKQPDKLRALVIAECGMVEGRGGPDLVTQFQILVYGDDGKLAMMYTEAGPTFYKWASRDGQPAISEAIQLYGNEIFTATAKIATK